MPRCRVSDINGIWHLPSEGPLSTRRWPWWDSVGRPPEMKANHDSRQQKLTPRG